MHDPEFDAFTRDDLVAEITAMRLKFKDEVVAEVERLTEDERQKLSDAAARFAVSARDAVSCSLREILTKLHHPAL